MRRGALFLLILLVLRPVAAGAQQRPYIDPALRGLMRADMRAVVERAVEADPRRAAGRRWNGTDAPMPRTGLERANPFADLALDRGGPSGSVRVGVLARLREPVPASLAALRRAGASIGTVVGRIATARVPLDALDRLAGLVEVERLSAARRLSLVNDSSMKVIRADEVRRRDGDQWYGSAGRGVIVGLYDTGIDYRHDDFRDGRGRSRILGIWDRSQNGNPPPGFAEGYYCDRASLDDGSCPERDFDGHGTHVAGTMAGDGSAAGGADAYRFAGVAPAAELLAVKAGTFLEDEIIEGVDWIFRTAEAQGRPAVVNLSLGLQWGPRDGTSLFDQALSALTGPGRILVVSAGNEGQNGNTSPTLPERLFHAVDTPVAGVPLDFVIEAPTTSLRSGTNNDYAWIELWYDGADRLDIEVVRPDGRRLSAPFGGGAVVEERDPEGCISIDNAVDGANPDNGDFHAVILLVDCDSGGGFESGEWTVRAVPTSVGSGGRPVHLWISASRYGAADQLHGVGANFDNGYVVSSPGTAREVVTVGAFVTRTNWTDATGNGWQWTYREAVGDIAFYSSGGPTRDGRLKPEITAPGTTIISALSANATGTRSEYIAPGGRHVVSIGTSMASPHVAGAVAAMLQHEPTLTPADVKALLQRTAIRDAYTSNSYTGEPAGVAPNNQWGYGKLDVRAAVEDLVDPAVVAGVLVVPDADSVAIGRTLPLWAQAYNAVGDTVGGAIVWSSSDPAIAEVDANGVVTGRALGTVTISAASAGATGSAQITVVRPVAAVAIAPGEATLVAGEDTVLVATPLDDGGRPLAGRDIVWASTDTLVARVDSAGRVSSLAVGAAGIVATAEERSDTARIQVLAPSTLIVEAEAVPQPEAASTAKGTRLVLLRLRLRVEGPEAIRVERLGFTLTGDDPLTRVQLFDDRDADATLDAGEPVLANSTVTLVRGEEQPVRLTPSALMVSAGDSASALLALELSGGTPNGTGFQARYDPGSLRTVGVRSGAADRLDGSGAPVASATVQATVLRPDEVFALSENPVMSDRVIFNFRERPKVAAVYTLAGGRVIDLLRRMETDGRVEWDLRNEKGADVAPGIYLVVFDVAGRLVTEKLIIVRRTGGEE